MYRRRRDYRRHRRRDYDLPRRNFFTSAFRTPASQIAVLLVVALVIFIILQMGGK